MQFKFFTVFQKNSCITRLFKFKSLNTLNSKLKFQSSHIPLTLSTIPKIFQEFICHRRIYGVRCLRKTIQNCTGNASLVRFFTKTDWHNLLVVVSLWVNGTMNETSEVCSKLYLATTQTQRFTDESTLFHLRERFFLIEICTFSLNTLKVMK